MRPLTKALLAGGGVLAAWIGWGLYSGRSAEAVPYERIDALGDVDIRRYPASVLAETTARDQLIAFRRLFEYISGANEAEASVSMTAPVETTVGTKIAMTAPVRTESAASGLRMGFFLPPAYDLDSAPQPTAEAVTLREVPARRMAAIGFSWYAPAWRVKRYEDRLRDALDGTNYEPTGDPSLLRYDDPWTPPFMRRNEVVVELEPPADQSVESASSNG
jgi:hypothetical protein